MSIALTVVLTAVSLVAVATSASAETLSLVVDSTDWGGADARKGDGVCLTADGRCTLRAAIEESNANKSGKKAVITVSEDIADPASMTGTSPTVNAGHDQAMTYRRVTSRDWGAIFHITAPVTIDLDHRLLVDGSSPSQDEKYKEYQMAAFFIDGKDITILNADQVTASGTSFVIGHAAKNIRIDGSAAEGSPRSTIESSNTTSPGGFVVIREKAEDIVVRGYDVRGFKELRGGVFVFNEMDNWTHPTKNVTFEDISVDYPSEGDTCLLKNGSGCRPSLVRVWEGGDVSGGAPGVWVQGLTFRRIHVTGLSRGTGERESVEWQPNGFLFNASASDPDSTESPTVENLTIEDSTFLRNDVSDSGRHRAFITLPYGGHLKGKTVIRNNVFTSTDPDDVAIYVSAGPTVAGPDSTASSDITIEDNYFNGYASEDGVVRLERTGIATVRRNTFGPKSGSQTDTQSEETSSSGVMVNNVDSSANQKINTWFPNSGAVVGGVAPEVGLKFQSALDEQPRTCLATVSVQRPTSPPVPGEPAELDLYWTATTKAEVYLGSVQVSGTGPERVAFPLPWGEQTLPDGERVTPVGSDGTVTGGVRVQTQVQIGGNRESSQYSRVAELSGNCIPSLTLTRADPDAQETKVRLLDFLLTSTAALNANSVELSDFEINFSATGEGGEEWVKPGGVAITEVADAPSGPGTAFTVTVKVSDSAKVTLALPENLVSTVHGEVIETAAANDDAVIDFINPLSAVPSQFTLVTGDPSGRSYQLRVDTSAPAPEAALDFVVTVPTGDDVPQLKVDQPRPVIPKSGAVCDLITVTADEADVTPGTTVTITHTVTSQDPRYDGLYAPNVYARLFDTDPVIDVTKRAFRVPVDETPSDVEAVKQYKEASVGASFSRGEGVCFVYTVTNKSEGEASTDLNDVQVTDTDKRLGDKGLIGTIDVLQAGATESFFACTTIVPGDTTLRAPSPEG